jgi:hypothetical protein
MPKAFTLLCWGNRRAAQWMMWSTLERTPGIPWQAPQERLREESSTTVALLARRMYAKGTQGNAKVKFGVLQFFFFFCSKIQLDIWVSILLLFTWDLCVKFFACNLFYFIIIIIIIILQYEGLNPGPCICKAGALQHEPYLQLLLLSLFFK